MARNNFLIIVLAAVMILAVNYVVYGFSEPAGPPPGNNVPAPLNVGPLTQNKEGNLELHNLKARGGIELGGVFRSAWPGETGAGLTCPWEGTKCDCHSDSSSFADLSLTVGLTCGGGEIRDIKIVGLDISTRKKRCSPTPPAGCTAGLYSYKND